MIRLQASTDSAHLESCGIGDIAPQYGGIRTRLITSFLPAIGRCELRWDESEARRDRVFHRSSPILRSPRSPILHSQPHKKTDPRPAGNPSASTWCGRVRAKSNAQPLRYRGFSAAIADDGRQTKPISDETNVWGHKTCPHTQPAFTAPVLASYDVAPVLWGIISPIKAPCSRLHKASHHRSRTRPPRNRNGMWGWREQRPRS
jgi:hypothetical protein